MKNSQENSIRVETKPAAAGVGTGPEAIEAIVGGSGAEINSHFLDMTIPGFDPLHSKHSLIS